MLSQKWDHTSLDRAWGAAVHCSHAKDSGVRGGHGHYLLSSQYLGAEKREQQCLHGGLQCEQWVGALLCCSSPLVASLHVFPRPG